MGYRIFWLLAIVVLAGGCSGAKATFVVDVVNKTALPLSAGLIKVGGPVMEGWATPEQIAINVPQLSERKWGTLVLPGQTVTIGPRTGEFESGTRAVLRVYSGDVPVSALIAYGRSDPGRLEVQLLPGKSALVIGMQGGRLQATAAEDGRVGAASAAGAAIAGSQ